MLKLSIVIPTFNRVHILEKVVQGFLAQTESEWIGELIIVDDGSTDDTAAKVSQARERAPFPVRYLRQSNRGPAAARNLGNREAQCEVVLFMDDDVEPDASLVKRHGEWHEAHKKITEALLGYVTWAPEVHATPFMRWYGEKGALFGYSLLKPHEEVDFWRLYTCNVSFKRQFLLESGGFDEEFKFAAYEDFEVGYRLHNKGMTLYYDSTAIGFHHQRFTFVDACKRAERVAAGYQILSHKEAFTALPTSNSIQARAARALLRAARPFLSPLRSVMDSRVRLPDWFYRMMYWSYADQALRKAMVLRD